MTRADARIAVLFGGPSAEAEVSRSSAESVAAALRETYANVEVLSLDHALTARLKGGAFDVVFPVLHGPPGEDGTLQGYLEILGLPYVGSGVQASAVGMDKVAAKLAFAAAGLPLADQVVVTRDTGISEAVSRVQVALGARVVVKPTGQGSALGVSIVDNANDLHSALTKALSFGPRALVERRLDGREITVGVIDTNDGPKAFDVIEIVTPEDSWYDYEHRYTKGLSEHVMPAVLPEAQTARLQAFAVAAHVALGCRDLSRADFVVGDDATEILLEVNTMPGMTPTSNYPDGARSFGLGFAELVSYFVERALDRARMGPGSEL